MGKINSKTVVHTEPLKSIQAHSAGVNCFALSPDQTILASGSDDCTIRLWTQCDAQEDYMRCYQILAAHTNYVTTLVFFHDKLLSASADRDIRKWDVKTGQCLLVFTGHDDIINKIVCARNHVFSASNDKTAICWDFDTGKPITQFKGHVHNVNTITCSGFGEEASNGTSGDGSHKESEDQITALIKQMGPRECVYTGSADKTAKAWSTRSGKCLLTFKGHTGAISEIALDKEGHILYTASLDATVRSWFAESAKAQFVFESHKSEIVSLYLVDKTLYTASTDCTAKSWLLSSGTLIRTYRGHKRTVNTVKKEGPFVVTTSDDGHVRCFEEKTGTVCYIYGNKAIQGCNTCEITDYYVITTGDNGEIFVWKKWNSEADETKPDEMVDQIEVTES